MPIAQLRNVAQAYGASQISMPSRLKVSQHLLGGFRRSGEEFISVKQTGEGRSLSRFP